MPEVKRENQKVEIQANGLSITSLVTGISGLVFIWWPGINIILSVLGVIFGAIALKKKQGQRGMAIAGLVTGIVGVALLIGFWLFVVVLGVALVGSQPGSGYHYYSY